MRGKYPSDLSGLRFGRLTVIKKTGIKNHQTVWLCKCDCGDELEVIRNSLVTHNTKSCGCLTRKHGEAHTRLYIVWQHMLGRCYKPYMERYKNYGGRGIVVCDEWHDYPNFRDWAIANGYDPNAKRFDCTLDRIDNNGNYCPENCRWIPMIEQHQNKTNTRYITVDGERMTIRQASQKYGVSYAAITQRISKLGWSESDSAKKPLRADKRRTA